MGEGFWASWRWQTAEAAWLLLAVLLSYAIGSCIGRVPQAIRAVTSSERLRREKEQLRAEQAFAQHSLSRTRQRTGCAAMVSLLERHVYVLPDSGIGPGITPAWSGTTSSRRS